MHNSSSVNGARVYMHETPMSANKCLNFINLFVQGRVSFDFAFKTESIKY